MSVSESGQISINQSQFNIQVLTQVQSLINEQKSIAEKVQQKSNEGIVRVKERIDILSEQMEVFMEKLLSDLKQLNDFKNQVLKELKRADFMVRTLERMKSGNLHLESLPSPYFLMLVNIFEARMQQYAKQIEDLERFLKMSSSSTSSDSVLIGTSLNSTTSLSKKLSSSRSHYSPKTLVDIMRNQYEFFLSIASQVAILHEMVQEQRMNFLNYRRKFFNDRTNPFEEADRREKQRCFLLSAGRPSDIGISASNVLGIYSATSQPFSSSSIPNLPQAATNQTNFSRNTNALSSSTPIFSLSNTFGGTTPNTFGGTTPNTFGGTTPNTFGGGTPNTFGGTTLNTFGGGTLNTFGGGTPNTFGGTTPNTFGGGTLNTFGGTTLNTFGGGTPNTFGGGTPNTFGGGTPNTFGGGTSFSSFGKGLGSDSTSEATRKKATRKTGTSKKL